MQNCSDRSPSLMRTDMKQMCEGNWKSLVAEPGTGGVGGGASIGGSGVLLSC